MPSSDAEFLKKLRAAFKIEADEHLQAITAGLLDLEKMPGGGAQAGIVETIFREAHSLKGAARAVNRSDVESVCQALETVFAAWKRGEGQPTPQIFDTLNRAVNVVAGLLDLPDVAVAAAEKNDVSNIIQDLRQMESHAPVAAAPTRPGAPVVEQEPPPPPPAPAEPPRHEPEKFAVSETVRIPVAKMDALLLQAEEMIAVKLATLQHAADLRETRALIESWNKEWNKASRDVRNLLPSAETRKVMDFLDWNRSYMRTLEGKVATFSKLAEQDRRTIGGMVDTLLEDAKKLVMLPFSTLLDLFPKLARDLSRDQGKDVNLVIRGKEIEIDKRILEEMKDPLIHLVRNAIDHGIEKPELRTRAGKPGRGTVTIAIMQTGNKVEISVADDGNGIDTASVTEAAVKAGFLSAEEAGQRNEQEALSLIFLSGISTSALITEISGRGLGMAIVREKVEKLGGTVSVDSRLQAGTSFRIRLPVTLATFKGLLVSVAGQTFVIPAANVERVVRVNREDVKTVENRETIPLNGQAVSLVRLDEVLELPRKDNAPDVSEVVVLGAAEKRVGFAVDDIINEQEVLVKNLGKPLARVRNIAGATILGAEKAVLILNVADLLKSAVKTRGASLGASQAMPSPKKKSILVVEDSITARMLLKNILESAQYQVTTATDGLEGWTAVKTKAFDLVVSDVEMPRMDGFELTRKIRSEKQSADLPVVLVTALASREHRERGVEVGANAYIVKSSFDQSNLLEVVQRLV